jgi:D-alanyl-D-alanine carboxypeptidase (penicillin-binding protein 5/6)
MKGSLLAAPLSFLVTLCFTSCETTTSRPGNTAYLPPGHPAYAQPAAPNYPMAGYPAQAQGQPPRPQYPYPQPMPPAPPQQPAIFVPPAAPMVFASPSNLNARAPSINAASYILVDARSGSVIAARNADTVRGVASTQKILTALLVASDVAVEPSKLGIKPGEVYTRRQLLYAFLIKSSNDVANVLARDNAGSTTAFAAKMTARARSLGATQSVFRNAHGLTAGGQYSTARDMARVALAAYRNPVIRDAVRRQYYTFTYASGRKVTLENTNDLLGRMSGCDGMKTGYTAAAGRCLISCAHSRNREVILVQLGTKTKYIWNDGSAMMRYGLGS